MSEKITWKKGILQKTGTKVIRNRKNCITIFYDKIEEDSISYTLIRDEKITAVLYNDYNIIEGE